MLEVQLNGVKNPVLMQLNTGCDVDLVYGISFDQLGLDVTRAGQNQVLLGGTVGSRRFERERFYVRKSAAR